MEQLRLPDLGDVGRVVAWPWSVERVVKQPSRRWRRCGHCLGRRAATGQQFCLACLKRQQAGFGMEERP